METNKLEETSKEILHNVIEFIQGEVRLNFSEKEFIPAGFSIIYKLFINSIINLSIISEESPVEIYKSLEILKTLKRIKESMEKKNEP